MNEALRAGYEADNIRNRLNQHERAYLIRPSGIAVAQEMVRCGELVGTWGTGKDAGIFIVSRTTRSTFTPGGVQRHESRDHPLAHRFLPRPAATELAGVG